MKQLFKNKKAWNFLHYWIEYASGLFFLLCLIITILSPSLIVTLITVFICGIIIGRYLHLFRYDLQMRLWIMIIAAILGLLVGASLLSRFRANYKINLILIIVGMIVGYYLRKKGHTV